MKIKILLTATLVSFLVGGKGYAQFFSRDLKGTAGGVVFKLEGTARDIAMGGSSGSSAAGADAVFSNPAGVSVQGGPVFSASHARLFENVHFSQAAAAIPFRNVYVGVYGGFLGMDDIDKYTATGLPAGDSYSPYSLSSGLYVSGRAGSNGYLGAGLKGIYQEIDSDTAVSGAVDAGYLRHDGDITSSISIRNAGLPVKFRSKSDPLPLAVTTSLAWYTPLEGLLLSGSICFPYDNIPSFHAGSEYVHYSGRFKTALRLGYNSAIADDHGVLAGFSIGGGINFSMLMFDYAWRPWGDLNSSHRISISWRPGVSVPDPGKEYIFSDSEKQSYLEYFYMQGLDAYRAGNFKAASEYFERVLKLEPDNIRAREYLNDARQGKTIQPGR